MKLVRRNWKPNHSVPCETVPAFTGFASVGGSSRARDWPAGFLLLDNFRVARVLGKGGMGKVYLVDSLTTNRRFAVKRAKTMDDAARRRFLGELQTWIDMPKHPNLVNCQFFRTDGDEVMIFSDYIEGGSLEKWITSGKLYKGRRERALERMLDVAIQFAWGLHCVHELGLVHQDVKPGNLLMGVEQRARVQGVKPRVTDYGLTRARDAAGDQHVPERGRMPLVSRGGCTPEYCSPEQERRGAKGRTVEVTHKTDIWSWGVSVLEMFNGGVTWKSGSLADKALAAYLKHKGEDRGIPAMPAGVVDILRGCLRRDPDKRWEDMAKVVDRLKAVFRELTGREYARTLAPIERRSEHQTGVGARRTREGSEWGDPQRWRTMALVAAGREPVVAGVATPNHAASRLGRLVADLAVYDEARLVYDGLVRSGRRELETDLAELCLEAAGVHETANDYRGSRALCDQAIRIYERLVAEGRPEMECALAGTYLRAANAAIYCCDGLVSAALCDRSIRIYELLVKQGWVGSENELAGAYLGKANALWILKDCRCKAIEWYDRAIAIREHLVIDKGMGALDEGLALAYGNKATAVGALGDKQESVALFDRAIAIRERLVDEGRRQRDNNLARLYQNKANVLRAMGEKSMALPLFEKVIEIRERLVNVEGRDEFANDLARAYMNKAIAVEEFGDWLGGLSLYDQAIAIYERLVGDESLTERRGDLAWTRALRAETLDKLGRNDLARSEAREAVTILREEVARVDRADLEPVLEWAEWGLRDLL